MYLDPDWSPECDPPPPPPVSQQASGVLVEVNEGAEFVLLPCQASEALPNDTMLLWLRQDGKIIVHQRQSGKDEPGNQFNLYKERTTLMDNAMQTGNLSLKLKRPTLIDTDTYRCKASKQRVIKHQSEVQLSVFSLTERELKDGGQY